MTYKELQTEAIFFKGAVILDGILSRQVRVRIKEALLLIIPLFIVVGFYFDHVINIPFLFGITSLALFVWLVFFITDGYFDSFYFQDVPVVFTELGRKKPRDISYEVAQIALSPDGITAGLLTSASGKRLMQRLGIDEIHGERFLHFNKPQNFSKVVFPEKITFSTLVEVILETDQNFQKFLLGQGYPRADVIGAAEWVERETMEKKKERRWWGRDALSKLRGVGKDWSYGIAHYLLKYGYFPDPHLSTELYSKEIELTESILARHNNANTLLLVSDIEEAEIIVGGIVSRIINGTVLTTLEHKRVFVFDIEACVQHSKSKEIFEIEVRSALDDAVHSDEMIIVIQNILSVTKSAEAIGVDLPEILRPYLESHNIQFILCGYKEEITDIEHAFLGVMHNLEEVFVADKTGDILFRPLEQYICRLERHSRLTFTYGAMKAIAKAVESYAEESSQVEAISDLVEDVAVTVSKKGEKIITASAVYPIVTKKTGIKQGKVENNEKEILLHLEERLGERVVGQSKALEMVAGALRRSRAGISDTKRPIGSFLFLGPTGVGKTETAKALSDIYFGMNVNVTRLDMSEYATEYSLTELLGVLPGRSSSTLTSILREHMTGVILLDEFEKAHSKVHNLFLQILDEGFFTDGRGKKVSLRNCIIIATSNAASDKIFDMVRDGKEPNEEKEEIIDSIIHAHIFSPELLNRFDSVVIFHPLGDEEMKDIAKMMLSRMKDSLREKGFDLEITDELVSYIATVGRNNTFGARALRRAVQEKLEDHIAKKIIAYDIQPGTPIVIHPEELRHVKM